MTAPWGGRLDERDRRAPAPARPDPGRRHVKEEKRAVASTPGQISPWRYLAAFAGRRRRALRAGVPHRRRPARPKLGIDLQGGTRVTLAARTETEAGPPREQLLQAQQIIEERVNGLGVSGAEVVLDGTNLTITVPGEEGSRPARWARPRSCGSARSSAGRSRGAGRRAAPGCPGRPGRPAPPIRPRRASAPPRPPDAGRIRRHAGAAARGPPTRPAVERPSRRWP